MERTYRTMTHPDYPSIVEHLNREGIRAGVRIDPDGKVTEIDVPCPQESYSNAYLDTARNVYVFEGHWLGGPFVYEGWSYRVQHDSAFLDQVFVREVVADLRESNPGRPVSIGVTTIGVDTDDPNESDLVWAVVTRSN